MASELHDISAPVFIRGLSNLAGFLEKARAHAEANGIPEAELIEARLYEDMHPLPAQIQRASDFAKLTMVRLGQVESVAMADTETSFPELQDRIQRTIDFVKAVPADAVNGREDATIEIKLPSRTLTMNAREYLLGFAMPNFYFHLTTAYAILRHKGMPLGKMDFMGAV
ncbi:DUF1993 family protein [Sphingomonas sp.]|uniref:DUF1993 domain-containing protein n=1 Tax=Sphingomonas sp. TaxID=28214 RepID=UPI001B265506|nr:DUF1993 domain-containing protein [Sphingomonas sp.]MBO9713852.1 DUF1993 domain-containing protein [Sphingomonas sp.]